jgi:hypothetical protein
LQSILSDKEKKRRQHEKELNSLRNKMGSNIVWFDALAKKQQYDLLFLWKREKWRNDRLGLDKPQKKIVNKRYSGYLNGGWQIQTKKVEVITYPSNLKHFLKENKQRFRVSTSKMRESQLKHLLD